MFYSFILPILLIIIVFGAVNILRKKLDPKTFRMAFTPVLILACGGLWYSAIFTEEGNYGAAAFMTALGIYHLYFYKATESN